MQDMQDMIDRLNQSGKRLSKGHRKIAQYIVEHYDKAVFMTASRLRAQSRVSSVHPPSSQYNPTQIY